MLTFLSWKIPHGFHMFHLDSLWFGNQLAEVFPEMMQTMDRIEKEQRLVRTEDLPGVNALHGFVSLIYNAEQLTKILGVWFFMAKKHLLHAFLGDN